MLWIGILVGACFIWHAVRIGFYEMWILLLNITFSIYLAFALRPAVGDTISPFMKTPCANAIIVGGIAIVCFLVLHSLTYVLLTSQFAIQFPRLLDTLGAAILGFATGFLIWSFAGCLIYITPIAKNVSLEELGFSLQFEQFGKPYLCRWYNSVDAVVSRNHNDDNIKLLIDYMTKDQKPKVQRPQSHTEPNTPVEPNDKPQATPVAPSGTEL